MTETLFENVIPEGIFATINDGKDFSAALRNDYIDAQDNGQEVIPTL